MEHLRSLLPSLADGDGDIKALYLNWALTGELGQSMSCVSGNIFRVLSDLSVLKYPGLIGISVLSSLSSAAKSPVDYKATLHQVSSSVRQPVDNACSPQVLSLLQYSLSL